MKENVRIILWLFLVSCIAIFIACTCNIKYPASSNDASVSDTTLSGPDSNLIITDTTAKNNLPDRRPASIDTSAQAPPEQNQQQQQHQAETMRGYAIVYCPSKMIIHVPSVIDAAITKNEFDSAYAIFVRTIQQQNPGTNVQQITKDVIGDSINLYNKMRVDIEFDPDDFKQISKNEITAKSFNNYKTLDWEWIIKPLRSTRKSIIKFNFYGIDPDNDEKIIILEKTINVAVKVDARSFLEKWSDFLLDDPKTTITAILIPLLSFFGGFFTAKKSKKQTT
ncbi:hypothetical protein [Parafilimonas sp.]|uniref:hypothetical protein n=1 Tax=Parafilimonas sp. TaxID=1969739 RepID=UPI0039E4F19B